MGRHESDWFRRGGNRLRNVSSSGRETLFPNSRIQVSQINISATLTKDGGSGKGLDSERGNGVYNFTVRFMAELYLHCGISEGAWDFSKSISYRAKKKRRGGKGVMKNYKI